MLEKLNDYYERGYLIKQVHPTLPLIIWNYSQTTQFERAWDEVTLMCRGLVTDEEGNIVARPFPKFFNFEESRHNVGTGEFEVYEKMDGSLGILFFYEGNWIFASRGSFTSEQALKFKEIFDKKEYNYKGLECDKTYMFEIIYPENRIVVDYKGLEDVVMLGKIRTHCGTESNIDNYSIRGFNVVLKYDGVKDFTDLLGLVEDDREGFIVHFNSTGSKCKIKGEEYVRLHRIMTQLSTTSVWDVLAHGESMESLLVNVPDEFYDKIRKYEKELNDEFESIGFGAKEYYQMLVERIGTENRARFAEYAKSYKYSGLIFAQLDGREISESIWKIIKPKYKAL